MATGSVTRIKKLWNIVAMAFSSRVGDWEITFEYIPNHLRWGKESIHLVLYREYGSVLEAGIGEWEQH